METNFVCNNCETIKQTYNNDLLLLRTSFVEYKKRVICTDKLFKQLTAKRSQVARVEGKLKEANNTLTQAQEQFKSTLISHKLTAEKCKSLEQQLANVTAERDKELCDLLTMKQQKAALEDKLKTTSRGHLNAQLASAEKIKKLESKLKSADKKPLEKVTEQFVAQGLELTLLKQELESQRANCVTLKKELDFCKSNIDETLKDKFRQQEIELNRLQVQFCDKRAEIKTLKESLSGAKEANKQVESLVEKLGRQVLECSLLRDMITNQHEEIELLRQTATKDDENLRLELKARENEINFLRQRLNKKDHFNNATEEKGENTICSLENAQANFPEQDSQRVMLDTELQNLRKQIETMKFELDKNDTEQLKTQLAERESETLSLKNELEMQRHDLEVAKEKLEAHEKDVLLRTDRSQENSASIAFNNEEVSKAEEIAALKLEILTLQSKANLTAEAMVQIKVANATACDSEHISENNAASVASAALRQSDEEVAELKLKMSALEREVDLKTKEIEKLNVANKLLCKSDKFSESNSGSVSTTNDSAIHGEMRLQLSNLQREVDLKAKEIEHMREKEIKNVKSYEDLKEKGRLTEERAFELVAELAQLKVRDKGTNSVSQKCIQLEKMLSLRDLQITQLRTELKGLLSCTRLEPRKPIGADSASSGRGSCGTSDLEDSAMLVDLDLDPDVSEILRSMATMPTLLSPIDAAVPPVHASPPLPLLPLAATRRYDQPPERTMQEKMLLALVESVRSATESYEKLYGTTIAVPTPSRPPPESFAGCAKPSGNVVSSFKVVNEWIKNVSPEIGADQRSSSDRSGWASSSKESVREVNIVQKSILPDRQMRAGGTSREMSSAFSGRRAPGGAGITLVPQEVVALTRQLKSVSVPRSPYASDLKRVRNSVAMANMTDLFVVGKAPTMDSLCANLDVPVPSMFSVAGVDGNSTGSSTNKRTTRSQVLNRTKGPSAGSAVKAKKIPPISKSFVRGMLAPNYNSPIELNYAKKETIVTESATSASKTFHCTSAISVTAAKSEVKVPKGKKKRKAIVDHLFGSDDDPPSAKKKQCADDMSMVYIDDEISIGPVLSSEPVTVQSLQSEDKPPHYSLRNASRISPVKSSQPKSPPVLKSVTPSDMNTILLEVPLSNDVSTQDASSESSPKTAEPVPKFPVPESKKNCEMPVPNPKSDNNVQSEVMPLDSKIDDQVLGSSELEPKAKNSPCKIETSDPQLEAKNMVCKMETMNTEDKDASGGLSQDNSCIMDSSTADLPPAMKTSTVDAINSEEIKSLLAHQLVDDDLSDCELVIADLVDEPLQITTKNDDSSDDNDIPPRLSVSVQTELTVKDESSEYDSDDEPLSTLLNRTPITSSPTLLRKSPIKRAATALKTNLITSKPSICIPSPPPISKIKQPFFYKPQELAEDACPPVTLDLSSSVEKVEPEEPSLPPLPPPPKILKDETGVWNRRVYARLAHNEAFNIQQVAHEAKISPEDLIMVRYLRLMLQKFLSSRNPLEEALTMTVNNILAISEIFIAKEVVKEVTNDKGRMEPNESDELETTEKVRKLIQLIVTMHKQKPTVADQLLTEIEQKLCNLSIKPVVEVLKRFISLHLGICLRLQMSERMRTFLYDILYCYAGQSMFPVCLNILKTAPFSLKHGFVGQDDIVSLTVAYTLQFGKNEYPHEDQTLVHLVSQRYKYNEERLPSAAQLVERMVRLLEGGNPDFVEACLVLLSKRLGWSCASTLIVVPMRLVVERWQFGSTPLSCAVVALRVIAYIVRTVPKNECDLADTLFDRISALLHCGKPEINEPVLEVLMMMGREKHHSTVISLLRSHGGTSSEEFTACATAYIAKVASGVPKRVSRPPEWFNARPKAMRKADDKVEHSVKADDKNKQLVKADDKVEHSGKTATIPGKNHFKNSIRNSKKRRNKN